MDYRFTPLTISVHKTNDDAMLSESATHVTIHDEGGGPFVTLRQFNDADAIRLDEDEIEHVLEAARSLFHHYRNPLHVVEDVEDDALADDQNAEIP